MTQESPHPCDERLAAFNRGTIEAEQQRVIVQHLDGCPHCVLRLEELSATDLLLGKLRRATRPTPSAEMSTQRTFQSGAGNQPTLLPDRLADYVILAEVGRGGMGVVYQARQRRLNRLAAVKTILAHEHASDEQLLRFQREAELAARVRHPNVVQVYEVGTHGGRPFIAMEWIEGPTLAQQLDDRPLSPLEAALLTELLAQAVQTAHDQGVVHRDLKPANILLEKKADSPTASAADFRLLNGGFSPKIVDFGLARPIQCDGKLTQTGAILGTPEYMAPEQARGVGDAAGTVADVYSLGVILYKLLTGRPPFRADSAVETLRQVVELEPVAPRLLNSRVPRDLETICLKCLEKLPERRYPSAAALADDLRRFLEHRPVKARRIGGLGKLTRWSRRNPVVAASLSTVLAIFLTAFALVTWSYFRAEDALQEQSRLRKKAEDNEKAERWERYRANMASAASALQLQHASAAKLALEAAPEEHRGWEWRHFHSRLDGAQTVLQISAPGESTHPLCVASNDGRRLAIRTEDGGVQLRDLTTLKVLAVVRQATQIKILAFSPDGKRLATGAQDGDISVWDTDSAQLLIVLRGCKKPIDYLVFDRDGTRLASSSSERPPVRLWDVTTGTLLAALEGDDEGGQVLFTLDSSRLLFSSGTILRSIDCRRPQAPPTDYRGHLGIIPSLAISPDGTRLASSSMHPENVIRLWELATGKPLAVLTGHKNAVWMVKFSPDGKRLVSASHDQTLRLWDVKTGSLIAVLEGHTAPVRLVDFSPDGARIVSGSADDTARLWDGRTGQLLGVLRGHQDEVFNSFFLRDGSRIVTAAHDGTLRFWDAGWFDSQILRGHASYVYDVAFSPDGEQIASVGWDGTLRTWEAATGKAIRSLQHPAPIVSSVAYDSTGERLLTLSRHYDGKKNREATIWDAKGGNRLRSIPLERSIYRDGRAAFSPRGDLIAVADPWQGVRFFDPGTGAELSSPPAQERPMLDVAFRPVGALLASGREDGTLRLWDPVRRVEIGVLSSHKADVLRVLFSPDGKLLASASADKTVRLCDPDTHQHIAELKHGSPIYGLAFSPDGKRLATGCADNTIRLWDLATHQEVAELRGHDAYVHAVAFSPDGTRLASASGDSTVRVWDTLPTRERAMRKKP